MTRLAPRTLLCICLALIAATAQAADALAPAGAKGTLTVEYLYESAGSKRSEGMYDPHAWRVKRNVTIVTELAAHPATALPSMQPLDAANTAQLNTMADKTEAMSKKMAPMMASAEAIMAKCGEDEGCITREAQKMGVAMQGTPQMATALSAKKEAQEAFAPGAPRYQAWRGTAQKSSYLIEETANISVTDPICTSRPRHRCTRDEVRKGAGEIPVPPEAKKDLRGAAIVWGVEVDSSKNTLTLALPVPLFPLPYTETITTDEPAGTHDTPTPKGPQKKQLLFRVNTGGGTTNDKPLTVPLKGGWRSQSGEQVSSLKGEFGDAGKLTVRWQFKVL